MDRQEAFRGLLEAAENAVRMGLHSSECLWGECDCWHSSLSKALREFKATVGTDDVRLVKFTQPIIRPPIAFDGDDPSQ